MSCRYAKHFAFSSSYEAEILRLRLRMTLQHSLLCAEKTESDFMVGAFDFNIVSEEDFEIFVKH